MIITASYFYDDDDEYINNIIITIAACHDFSPRYDADKLDPAMITGRFERCRHRRIYRRSSTVSPTGRYWYTGRHAAARRRHAQLPRRHGAISLIIITPSSMTRRLVR